MCIFCAETVKICAAASEHIFYVEANVWLLLETFQCFLMNVRAASEKILKKNVRLLPKDINIKKKNVQLFFRIMST